MKNLVHVNINNTFWWKVTNIFQKRKLVGRGALFWVSANLLIQVFGWLPAFCNPSVRWLSFPQAPLCFAHVDGFPVTRRYTDGLQRMLDHYHVLIGTLNEAESLLLDDHSQELVRVFRSGYKRLNWNSLGNIIHLSVAFSTLGCKNNSFSLFWLNYNLCVCIDMVNKQVLSIDEVLCGLDFISRVAIRRDAILTLCWPKAFSSKTKVTFPFFSKIKILILK